MPKKRYYQVRSELEELITRQKLAGNRLPPEAVLAEKLGVSRGTIREVMQTLASEGVISKKHGLGNFVHRSAIQTPMRIDTIQEFNRMIESGGYRSRMEKIGSSSDRVIDRAFFEKTAPLLGVEDPDELITLQSLYYADDNPAIYSQVFIPKDIILDDPDRIIKKTLFEFLAEFCNQTVEQTIIRFAARPAGERVAQVLRMAPEVPLIRWEEYYYNIYDEVICVALTHFHPEYMELAMLRKADADAGD